MLFQTTPVSQTIFGLDSQSFALIVTATVAILGPFITVIVPLVNDWLKRRAENRARSIAEIERATDDLMKYLTSLALTEPLARKTEHMWNNERAFHAELLVSFYTLERAVWSLLRDTDKTRLGEIRREYETSPLILKTPREEVDSNLQKERHTRLAAEVHDLAYKAIRNVK